ncbi:hypothetical protein BH762_gp070 [Gordonia phage OneUp]|uniref:Uncharacterized protein n=1 Tax=Gordonia phage OneUp TaxID=1838074 RepID=A0A160DEZ7_9CAUD|nr:hypothetical protein BH762_gp070 [Gordonia phage OneUp]ANA86449.1 hypothetical protein PBI_ONEUP_115 [Gordonia phage OneUp]
MDQRTSSHTLVYIVRPGENEELRMSLRSLRNLPHDEVWIVGDKPSWVSDEVNFIQGNLGPTSHDNVYNNIRLACAHPDVADEFVIMNDDFFITEQMPTIPNWYRSTLDEHIALPRVQRQRGWWLESLTLTRIALLAHGIKVPLSYELHVPFAVNKAAMGETLTQFSYVNPGNPPQWRSLYGNMHQIPAEPHEDCKRYVGNELVRPLHSCDDGSFFLIERELQQLFPEPSKYEVT